MLADRSVYPTLNPSLIPESTQYTIARTFGKGLIRFFLDRPGEQERFEAWKAERDARLAVEQNNEE